jgi:uncharacterized membrane protein
MSLSIKNYFKFGWETTKKNFLSLFLFSLLFFLVSVLIGITGSDIFSFSGIISILISPLFYFAISFVSLKFAQNEKFEWKNIFKSLNQKTYISFLMVYLINAIAAGVVSYLVFGLASIVPLLGSIIGFLAYIALIIYFIGVIFFAYYRLIDGRPDFWLAVKDSFKMAENHRWFLVKFILLAVLINFIGVILLGIGLFVTMPITIIALAKIYKEIKSN